MRKRTWEECRIVIQCTEVGVDFSACHLMYNDGILDEPENLVQINWRRNEVGQCMHGVHLT